MVPGYYSVNASLFKNFTTFREQYLQFRADVFNVFNLSPRFDRPDLAVRGTLPYHSAWRVLAIADDPGRLVESTLIYDLSPASRVSDTSWIKAGKASWNWWVNDVDA